MITLERSFSRFSFALALLVLGLASRASAGGFDTARFGSEHGHAAAATPFAVYYNPAALTANRKVHLALDVSRDADTHVVDFVDLEHLGHAAHVAVARGAGVGTEGLDVPLVREVSVAREVMHAHPLDRLLVGPGLSDLLDLGLGGAVAAAHDEVAPQAGLH